MCGIAGYVGEKNACEVVLDLLKKMEYRGYDSAGLSVVAEDGEIKTAKAVGRVSKLEGLLFRRQEEFKAFCGVGHTRWATHGRPCEKNAHPHTTSQVSVVHNGIIENSEELKGKLKELGYEFETETDTEAVAKLLDYYYKGDAVEAILQTQKELVGSYALGILFKGQEGKVFAVKKESPLVIGLGEKENYLCSDLNALLGYTNSYYTLEDGELAVITGGAVEVRDRTGQKVQKERQLALWQADKLDKQDYEHFMLKEMLEQPDVLKRLCEKNLVAGLPDFEEFKPDLESCEKIMVVACGSARYAGLAGKFWIEKFARVPVEVMAASEFRYANPILTKNTLVVVISQSGETADTLAALRLAKFCGVKTLGLINVRGSSMSREADRVIYLDAGAEVAVASTKAYMAQICTLYLLAVKLGLLRGNLSEKAAGSLCQELLAVAEQLRQVLKSGQTQLKGLAEFCAEFSSVLFIGRGLDGIVAKEGTLKLKELAYINAQSYFAGELKHGPIALINEETLLLAMVSQSFLQEKMQSNVLEASARGAQVLFFVKEELQKEIVPGAKTFLLPNFKDDVMPFFMVGALQMLAYFVALKLGRDIDKPRNLAKSVTVE